MYSTSVLGKQQDSWQHWVRIPVTLKDIYNSIHKQTLEDKNTRTIFALAITRSLRVALGNQLQYYPKSMGIHSKYHSYNHYFNRKQTTQPQASVMLNPNRSCL
jgi:hypothetical protein